MSVKTDGSGKRWIEVEVDVPGTPEQVWEAIATGPGVTSWFVPTEMHEDGRVVSHFGPGMESVATGKSWDPPRGFAKESPGFAPGAPPLATEWTIEARAGGTCTVRVVHSLFASTDEWDDQLEQIEGGWPEFFRILRLYLTHFRGQYGRTLQLMAMTPQPAAQVMDGLVSALGFADAEPGERRAAPPDVPPFAGHVEGNRSAAEHAAEAAHGHPPSLLVRLDEPSQGVAHVYVMAMHGQSIVVNRVYLYGDQAAAIATRDEPRWQAWMKARYS